MGRDAGGHADGDACRAVGQQVGKVGRKDYGFRILAVVGIPEIDGVFVDSFQQGPSDFRQPGLGISHGGRIISVHVAEIALSVDQRITLSEFLGQPDKGVVDGGVPVGMVFADDVANHPRAFLEPRVGLQFQSAHGVKQPPVNRFQAVADVRQGTRYDGGQRISEITFAQRIGKTCV